MGYKGFYKVFVTYEYLHFARAFPNSFMIGLPMVGQGLIEDGVIMAAMLQSNRPSYFLCRRLQWKKPFEDKERL